MKGFIETSTGELVSVKHIESVEESITVKRRCILNMISGKKIIYNGYINELRGKIHAALL